MHCSDLLAELRERNAVARISINDREYHTEVQILLNDILLNIDGFLASLRIGEIGLDNAQLSEAFYLICGPDETVAYQTWITQKSPIYKQYFSINVTPRAETSIDAAISIHE